MERQNYHYITDTTLQSVNDTTLKFTDYGVREDVQQALISLHPNIHFPNRLQQIILPPLLQEKKNVYVTHRLPNTYDDDGKFYYTGSGKGISTLLAGLQSIDLSAENILPDGRTKCQVMIFCPCRELSYTEASRYRNLIEILPDDSPLKAVKVNTFISGGLLNIREIIKLLLDEGAPQVLTTTPGYLYDLLSRARTHPDKMLFPMDSLKAIVFAEIFNLFRVLGDQLSIGLPMIRDDLKKACKSLSSVQIMMTGMNAKEDDETEDVITKVCEICADDNEEWTLERYHFPRS